jgi:hypothetical protein
VIDRSDWLRSVDALHAAGTRAGAVLQDPSVARRWDDASVLPGLTVGGVAGHLLGVVRATERRLELPRSVGASVVDPAVGYAVIRLDGLGQLDEPQFAVVREGAARLGARGWVAVAEAYDQALTRLVARLHGEDPGRLVPLPDAASATTVRAYTTTRLVELVVHADDLAESVGAPVAPPTADASDAVIEFLVRATRHRVGDAEVVRALAGRRPSDVLRAL